MPKTKNALIRQRVLDRCLGSIRDYSMKDLMDACNKELLSYGELPVTSTNTIREDLNQICSNYPDANIIPRRVGRNIFYSYEDRDYSIFKIPFKDEEIAQLTQTLMILSRFEGMPQFEWVEDFTHRFKSSLKLSTLSNPIVGFEENVDLRGREHFAPLFSAISNQQVLSVAYKNFKKDEMDKLIVHPYYLKQYNNRWFLFGLTEPKLRLSVLALDRIESIDTMHQEYIPNTEIDFQEYFDDMVGVSRPYGQPLQKVIFRVSNDLVPYIRTKPLHGTQRELRSDTDSVTMQIEVYINFELEQLILSHGEKIEILSPIELKEKIKQRVNACVKKYE